jgi:hypothetical protein
MRERFGNALYAILLVALAGLLGFLSTRFGFNQDWSHARSASLGDASLALLKTLDGPVEVTSYASRQGGLRAVIADFVDRYRRAKPDLSLRFVDPDADPNAMRAAGVAIDGELDEFEGTGIAQHHGQWMRPVVGAEGGQVLLQHREMPDLGCGHLRAHVHAFGREA